MNKLEWNLSKLFVNNDEFYKEINKIQVKTKKFQKYENIIIDEVLLLKVLDEKYKILEINNNILIYGSLKYYKNINDKVCIQLKDDAEKINNEIKVELKFIDKKIRNLGQDKINKFINKNPNLKKYTLLFDDIFRRQKHIQNKEINLKINDNLNQINSHINKYNRLIHELNYGTIDNIELTIANYNKYISSQNREVRKQAYLTVNDAFKKIQEECALILKSICDNRVIISNLEKYNSVLEKVLFEENIDPMIITVLINSVNSNLELYQAYLNLKMKFLNLNFPKIYDTNLSFNEIKIKYTLEEAIEIIKEALRPFGEQYLNVVEELLSNGYIDAEVNKNKHQSIVFSWNLYSFLNFNGSYNDLRNLIHEIGHIVNYYFSKKKQPFIYEDSSIFIGEIPAIINEILLNRYLYKNAGTKEEKLFYLSKDIESYLNLVYNQTLYTEFEESIYNLNQIKSLSANILNKEYTNLLQKYYGNKINLSTEINRGWIKNGRFFRWSYYSYKYAIGLIIANIVVNDLFDEKMLPVEQYFKFLSAGSSEYSLELLKILNIDFTNLTIINKSFNVFESNISKFKNLIKEEK